MPNVSQSHSLTGHMKYQPTKHTVTQNVPQPRRPPLASARRHLQATAPLLPAAPRPWIRGKDGNFTRGRKYLRVSYPMGASTGRKFHLRARLGWVASIV
jgi:hypothetical protein